MTKPFHSLQHSVGELVHFLDGTTIQILTKKQIHPTSRAAGKYKYTYKVVPPDTITAEARVETFLKCPLVKED